MMGLLRKTFRLSLITGVGVGLWKIVKSKTQFPWVGGNSGGAMDTGGGPPPVSAPAPPPPPAAVPATPAAPASPAPSSGEAAGSPRPAGTRSSKPAAGTGPARKAPTGRAEDPPGERLWVVATDGVCPQTHPVKAKLSSKIFHVPGTPHYSRTRADRCYPDEAAAVADGLRPPMH